MWGTIRSTRWRKARRGNEIRCDRWSTAWCFAAETGKKWRRMCALRTPSIPHGSISTKLYFTAHFHQMLSTYRPSTPSFANTSHLKIALLLKQHQWLAIWRRSLNLWKNSICKRRTRRRRWCGRTSSASSHRKNQKCGNNPLRIM